MIETNLQEAIAKISMDDDYRKKLINDPNQLIKDYGIKIQETISPKDGDANLINETIRPTATCSCCCAPA